MFEKSKKPLLRTLVAALGFGAMLSASAADPLKVGFVYIGPIGDHGWTYQHEQGRQMLIKELGDKVTTSFVENVPEGADAERVIRINGSKKSLLSIAFFISRFRRRNTTKDQ